MSATADEPILLVGAVVATPFVNGFVAELADMITSWEIDCVCRGRF